MNKKLLMVLSLLTLLSLAIFVSAELRWADGRYGLSDNEAESWSVKLHGGWNLVQGLADPSFIIGSSIGKEGAMQSIKAIYVFDAINKEYIQVYPNPEKTKLDSLGPYILQTPFWVYSSKDLGEPSYQTEKLSGNFQITWPAGWNLISISNEMVGKSLNEIKGTCNIEKAYFWTDKEQSEGSWVNILDSNEKFNKYNPRLGFAVKFTSDCKLGTSTIAGGTINPPPAIP